MRTGALGLTKDFVDRDVQLGEVPEGFRGNGGRSGKRTFALVQSQGILDLAQDHGVGASVPPRLGTISTELSALGILQTGGFGPRGDGFLHTYIYKKISIRYYIFKYIRYMCMCAYILNTKSMRRHKVTWKSKDIYIYTVYIWSINIKLTYRWSRGRFAPSFLGSFPRRGERQRRWTVSPHARWWSRSLSRHRAERSTHMHLYTHRYIYILLLIIINYNNIPL